MTRKKCEFLARAVCCLHKVEQRRNFETDREIERSRFAICTSSEQNAQADCIQRASGDFAEEHSTSQRAANNSAELPKEPCVSFRHKRVVTQVW